MSGTALAAQMRTQSIQDGRERRYRTLGDHSKVLTHRGQGHIKCFDCGSVFQNDSFGEDIAKDTPCES